MSMAEQTTKPQERGLITKRERAHLRALIRQHYALLRKEVTAEASKALAEVDTRIAEFRRANREQACGFEEALKKISAEANKKMRGLIEGRYAELFGSDGRWRQPHTFYPPSIFRRDDDEQALRRALVGQIRSKAVEARTRIEREENLRLREILVDALESDTALAIASGLPSLGDVFTVDLRAIEVGTMASTIDRVP